MCLIQSVKLREGGSQPKICKMIISVRLHRPSKPHNGLLVTGKLDLCTARSLHPNVSLRIARAEAEGLGNVSLCFFGATNENLAKPNSPMGRGKISIQRQCMFALRDPLCGSFGKYVE